MNVELYKKEAQRTMARLGELVHDSIHMTIGMNTECTEILEAFKKPDFDFVNLVEEVGDLMWYVANYSKLHDLPLSETLVSLPIKTAKERLEEIIICVGNLQDLDKKLFAYKKPYDANKQFGFFIHLNNLILSFCQITNIDFNKALKINIEKLRARYPEKFDVVSAVERDLDAERKILEQ